MIYFDIALELKATYMHILHTEAMLSLYILKMSHYHHAGDKEERSIAPTHS
jgi:hypothetical protein